MKTEFSAGGVVYRKLNDKVEFLVVQHSGHHRWVLPKGWIDPGETKEQTAIREVKEEAGVEGEIDEFQIVGTMEADPSQRKISNESPLGQGLLGAKVGESVVVKASVVNHTCKILKIRYS